jgi:heat shock protein HslJ
MKICLKTLICILILGLSGCQNENNAKHSRDRLISTKWIFLGFQRNDTKGYELVPVNLSKMDITFSVSHNFQAESSCNTAYGNYLIYEQNFLKIDSVVMTKMFCVDSTQSTWEDKYISGLKNSKEFKITNDTLSISTTSNVGMIFKVESQKTKPGN